MSDAEATVHVVRKRFDPRTMSVVEELVEVPGEVVEVPADVPEAPQTDLPEVPEPPADKPKDGIVAKAKAKTKRKRTKKNADA